MPGIHRVADVGIAKYLHLESGKYSSLLSIFIFHWLLFTILSSLRLYSVNQLYLDFCIFGAMNSPTFALHRCSQANSISHQLLLFLKDLGKRLKHVKHGYRKVVTTHGQSNTVSTVDKCGTFNHFIIFQRHQKLNWSTDKAKRRNDFKTKANSKMVSLRWTHAYYHSFACAVSSGIACALWWPQRRPMHSRVLKTRIAVNACVTLCYKILGFPWPIDQKRISWANLAVDRLVLCLLGMLFLKNKYSHWMLQHLTAVNLKLRATHGSQSKKKLSHRFLCKYLTNEYLLCFCF